MPSLTTSQKIAIAVTVPLAAVVVYLLLQWRQDDHDSEDVDEEITPHGRVDSQTQGFATSSDNVLEVKVPQSLVGAVIGRGGCNIKAIEKESQTRINLKEVADDSDDHEDVSDETKKKEKARILLIRGNRERTKNAELLIRKLIAEQPVVQEATMDIPQKVVGRIIGKGGKTIRQLCRISGARIKFDRESEDVGEARTCKIIGTEAQIAYAKGLVIEKINEDNAFIKRDKMKASEVSTEALSFVTLPTDGDYFGVYVSGMESPSRFWIQMVTKDSRQLDDLVERMTVYHGDLGEGRPLAEPKVGDLCCCPFQHDQSWYRAKITNILPSHIQLHYLDFGDCGEMPVSSVKQLKNEYCQLPFQAIECQLANVHPKDGEWSKTSCELFEKLSCCAKWKVLMARVVSFNGNIAAIELFDTNGDQDVNIEEELVKQDCAFYVNTDSTGNDEDLQESTRTPDNSTSSKDSKESIPLEEHHVTADEIAGNLELYQFSDESIGMDESSSFQFTPVLSSDVNDSLTYTDHHGAASSSPRIPVDEPAVSAVEQSVVSCADISQLSSLLDVEDELPAAPDEKVLPRAEEPVIMQVRADEDMSSPSGSFIPNQAITQRNHATEFQLDEHLPFAFEPHEVAHSEMAVRHSNSDNHISSRAVDNEPESSSASSVNLNDGNVDDVNLGDANADDVNLDDSNVDNVNLDDGNVDLHVTPGGEDAVDASLNSEKTPTRSEADSRPGMGSPSTGQRQANTLKGGKRVLAANFGQMASTNSPTNSREESEDDDDDDSLYLSAREDSDSTGFVSATGSTVDLRTSDSSEGDVTPSGYLSDSGEDWSGDETSEEKSNQTGLDSTLLAERLEHFTDQ